MKRSLLAFIAILASTPAFAHVSAAVTIAPPDFASASTDTPFRFGSQRNANDRRGLGPRVISSQKSQCRVRTTELEEYSPLRRGRPCTG